MTFTMKTIHKEMKQFINHLADADSFRITGDCSPRYRQNTRRM